MRYFALSVALMMMGLVAAGCRCDVPPYTEGRAERYAPPQIQFTGPDREELANRTAVDRPSVRRDAADLLVVTVPLRATDNQVLHIQYRVTFLDRSGNPLPGPGAWFHKTLDGGAWTPITFNSTSAQAADFQMEIRWAR